ncbi:MAG: hypothetical protein ACLFOY_12090 [Desulfatibacillaceae bacterium]
MEKNRFGLNAGRPRPEYKPKELRCTSCNGPLTQKDERSELIVCPYCGSHVDLSSEEKTILGKSPGGKWDFPLNVGDSWYEKNVRYEIIARLALIEDGDTSELSRQYLLYHPRRAPMWLDEYKGRYSLSGNTHVMPEGGDTISPFTKKRGDTLKTADGRTWVCEGTGLYEIAYVDGALPWIARVGDVMEYAEFSDKKGSGEQYEVQQVLNEVEFGIGRGIPLEKVREATGKPELHQDADLAEEMDAGTAKRWYMMLAGMAAVALVLNLMLALWAETRGTVVLRQHFTEQQLTGEAFSEPFTVAEKNDVVEVNLNPTPRLNNAWMAFDMALVRQDDLIVHVAEKDVSYYSGGSGEDSWSEGSRTEDLHFMVPEPGIYKLLVHAVSAYGNTSNTTTARHGLDIVVKDGALLATWFWAACVLSLVLLVAVLFLFAKWKYGDEWEVD